MHAAFYALRFALAFSNATRTTFFRAWVFLIFFPVCGALAQSIEPYSDIPASLPQPSVSPAPQATPDTGVGAQPMFMGDLKKKYDINKDGVLDEYEQAAMQKDVEEKKAQFEAAILAKYDVNKNGKLDDDERKVALEDQKKRLKQKRLQQNNSLDINEPAVLNKNPRTPFNPRAKQLPQSRSLTLSCVAPSGTTILQKYDTNKDGVLSKEEREKMGARNLRKAESIPLKIHRP